MNWFVIWFWLGMLIFGVLLPHAKSGVVTETDFWVLMGYSWLFLAFPATVLWAVVRNGLRR